VASLADKNELMGYILMKLVRPELNENYIIKTGYEPRKENLISELGIYGAYIADENEILINETGGFLLRTKSYGINEGGVASGYSALDSICLT
jgi:glutathione synthase